MAPTTESRLNVEALSKRDVLLLFSFLEGELEARDFVIQALKAQCRDSYICERYGKYNLSDPFLALQRDGEALQSSNQTKEDRRSASQRSDPLAILKMVVEHCRRMQEKMLRQLAAAENRHRRVIADLEEEKRKHAEDTAEGDDVTYILEKERERLLQQLEFEKTKTSRLERENKRLHDQLEDQRVQHKQLMTALSRECKRSATRAHEESQRSNELSLRLDQERAASQTLRAELDEQKKCAMQMEARREEILAEFDTEREQLGLKLRKEEARCNSLQEELEMLRKEISNAEENINTLQKKIYGHHSATVEVDEERESVFTNTPDPSQSPDFQAAYQAGIHQRFHATRHKFQGTSDQDFSLSSSPTNALHDPSPQDDAPSKQAARSTVTQALSRFNTQQNPTKQTSPNSSPFASDYRTVIHSGMLSPTIRSPTIPRAERGNPPPIPPKKPGLAETPPSPATLRATHMAQLATGCGRNGNSENTKESELMMPSSG
ncbi:hypothetical protein DNTS_015290 [Danionella cerebrum]|uniref:Cortactin-binding protein-2 N-terminal domain-containing protein n=1 Tax=Danionella cerebrum TaxID=2873325 RepID=A0A553QHD5_9TELE|nr:hypothetical protein DNTS_015290 [Danionella translucida]